MERHENVEAIGFDQISVFNSLHIASRRERAFMTTRTLTGTYSAGYALSSNYSALMIAASGLVYNANGALGAYARNGSGGAGGNGGLGVTIGFAATASNDGTVFGGQGGAGGYSFETKFLKAYGGAGGTGATAMVMSAGGTDTNRGGIFGGAGGAGGSCNYLGASGGAGGAGGGGIVLGGDGMVAITGGAVDGGAGGAGGYGYAVLHTAAATGAGGVGGIGIDIKGAGSVVNSAYIFGGSGGAGDNFRGADGAGGAGIVVSGPGSVANNGGTIGGGVGGYGRKGFHGGVGASGGLGVYLASGGSVVNSGRILGGLGGGGAGGYYGGAAGGSGGSGLLLGLDAAASRVSNTGTIAGGAGGSGAYGRYYGGGSGAGGTGLTTMGPAIVVDSGLIAGGAGAPGVYSHDGPVGGAGGVGVVLAAGGTVTATGQVVGGAGGVGGYGYYAGNGGAGGAGVILSRGGEVINTGATRGGDGGAGGLGAHAGLTGAAGYGVVLAGGGSVTNVAAGLIEGGVGVFAAAGIAATVTNFGTIQGDADSVKFASANDLLIAEAGAQFVGAIAGGGGTFELAGGAGTISGLGGAGVVSGSDSATFGGFANYVIGAGGKWTLGGLNAISANHSLTVDGTLGITGMLSLAFTRGTLLIDAGGMVNFSGRSEALAGTITGAGRVDFTAGNDTFNGTHLSAATMAIDGAAVTLENTIVLYGVLSAATTNLFVGPAGASLTGGGTLALSDSSSNRIVGLSNGDTLQNFSTITGSGMLGSGQMGLINRNRGVVDGNGSHALIIDTGSNQVANAGLIEATGAGGVTISSAVLSSGVLEAAGGTLTVNGEVRGPGHGVIASGALIVNGAFNQNVTFTATSGTLELGKSQGYAGAISGFSLTGGTSLDLQDIAFVSASEATFSGTATSGVLTVTDGTHTAHLHLSGNYLAATFTASSDGHGGVIIHDPTHTASAPPSPAPPPHRFIAAMAGLGATPAGPVHLPIAIHAPTALLATPRLDTA